MTTNEGFDCGDVLAAVEAVYMTKTKKLADYSPECRRKISNFWRFSGTRYFSRDLGPKYYNPHGYRV